MPPNSVPEQINLQLASPSVVVAAFVTYEPNKPTSPAVAMFGPSPNNMTLVTGITHYYTPPGRVYLLHFVRFTGKHGAETQQGKIS